MKVNNYDRAAMQNQSVLIDYVMRLAKENEELKDRIKALEDGSPH